MLRQRVFTALALVAVVLLALFNPDPVYWRLLINIIVLVAFWEWMRLCGIDSPFWSAMGCGVFIAVLYLIQNDYLPAELIIYTSCGVWLLLMLFTLTPALQSIGRAELLLFTGIVVLASACWLVVELRYLQHGIAWIFCYLVSVVAADIGAYFVGKRFGRTPLAPTISPGKTVQGLMGGLAFVAILFTPTLFYLFEPRQALPLLGLMMICALISVGGDLFESKLKRRVGLKDSSNILPGHGGLLDRIDSLIAAAPFFVLGLLLLGHFN